MAKKTPKKSGPTARKPAASSPPSVSTEQNRKLKTPTYRSFRLQKRIKHPEAKLPNAFQLFGRACRLLIQHWQLFLGVMLIYGLLNAIFVAGTNSSDLGALKEYIDEFASGVGGSLAQGVTLFAYLLGSSGNTANPTAGAYQFFLVLIGSLALIWALRQVTAGHKIGIRASYYQSMTPLIPFILVLCVIGLQLLPLLIGGGLYSSAISNGIAVYAVEKIAWGSLFFCGALLSFYLVCSSVFALYIVTLPEMTPMKALRSARQLVLHRRWSVLRKLLFLPLALVVLAGIIMIPVALFLTPIATVVFFALTAAGFALIHSYLYTLYRSLL